MGFPGTARFPEFARLPGLFGRVHLGLLFAIATAIMLWILLDFTTKGYEIKVIGRNREAARYAGIDLTHNTLLVVAISAGLAGLAGVSEVSGLAFRLQQGVLISYTSISIIVAWIANLRVWVAVLISVLIAALIVGGDQLQILFGLPSAVALVLQALLLFSILAGEFFIRYRIKLSRKPASVSEPASLLETR
jgi:simple sugar transport system permease protein